MCRQGVLAKRSIPRFSGALQFLGWLLIVFGSMAILGALINGVVSRQPGSGAAGSVVVLALVFVPGCILASSKRVRQCTVCEISFPAS
jgi:predicted MFS family arabinose efflux permease